MTLYNRTLVTQNNYTFGLVTAFGLASKALLKNKVLLAYKIKDQGDVSFRAENRGFRTGGF